MMQPMDMFLDPMKLAARLTAAQVETMRDMQKLAIRQMETFAKRGFPLSVEVNDVNVPVPVFSFSMSETQMRESFHVFADANLAAWSRMAEALHAMPGWAKWMNRAPGEFWTGVFDKFTTLDTFKPANDSNGAPKPSTPKAAPAPAPKSNKPSFLAAPKGQPDDLTQIKGIGPKLSSTLNALGIFHFTQIAEWTPEQCEWIDDHLAFKGRVQREGWVEQARQLAKQAA